MQVLINDLLSLSRVGRTELVVETVDTGALFEVVLGDLAPRLAELEARVVCRPLPVLRGYRSQLAQVFQNFLTNAIKYRRSDADLRVEVRAEATPEGWVFAFEDNGIGDRRSPSRTGSSSSSRGSTPEASTREAAWGSRSSRRSPSSIAAASGSSPSRAADRPSTSS